MRLPRVTLGLLTAAGGVAMAGALFVAPWLLGMSCVTAFVVLALHPVLTRPVLPAKVRLLVWAGLLGWLLSVLLQVRELAVYLAAVQSAAFIDILAFESDPQRLRAQALRAAVGAACQLLACAGFASALALVSPPRPRASVAGCTVLTAIAVIGAVTVASAWSATPEPAVVLPPGVEADLADTVTATTSVTIGVDLFGAALIGIMLVGAFLTVDGLSRARIPSVEKR